MREIRKSREEFKSMVLENISNRLIKNGYIIKENEGEGDWISALSRLDSVGNNVVKDQKISKNGEFLDGNGKKFYISIPEGHELYSKLTTGSRKKDNGNPEWENTKNLLMDYAEKQGKKPVELIRCFGIKTKRTSDVAKGSTKVGSWYGQEITEFDVQNFDKFYLGIAKAIINDPQSKAFFRETEAVEFSDKFDNAYTGTLVLSYSYSFVTRAIYVKPILTNIIDTEDNEKLSDIEMDKFFISIESEMRSIMDDNMREMSQARYETGLKVVDVWFFTYIGLFDKLNKLIKKEKITSISYKNKRPLNSVIQNIINS